MAGRLKRLLPLFAAVLSVAAGVAAAEPAAATLADPTRPPPALEAPAAVAGKSPAPLSGLQTVIMRKGRKPVAVINGETVELGAKLGEATLVKLSEREAVLQGPQGKEVLRLTPNAAKTPVEKGAAGMGRETGR